MIPPFSCYRLSTISGEDAGNRNMRLHCRTTWNADDYAVAVAEFNRLASLPRARVASPAAVPLSDVHTVMPHRGWGSMGSARDGLD